MRFILSTFAFSLLSVTPALAAGDGEHHALPLNAQRLSDVLPVSNSMIMVWIAVGVIVLFCRMATKKMSMVPAGLQNFAEWAFESLYSFLEGLMGAHLVKRTFWFFGSIFFFHFGEQLLGPHSWSGDTGLDSAGCAWSSEFLAVAAWSKCGS